jgi:hypothetical protein
MLDQLIETRITTKRERHELPDTLVNFDSESLYLSLT